MEPFEIWSVYEQFLKAHEHDFPEKKCKVATVKSFNLT